MGEEGLKTDPEGFLLDYDEWSRPWAEAQAERDGVVLESAHWQVIEFLRDYWAQYQMAPSMRLLVKALATELGKDCGTSRYVYRLFAQGAPQACRYAGLPRPTSCI